MLGALKPRELLPTNRYAKVFHELKLTIFVVVVVVCLFCRCCCCCF